MKTKKSKHRIPVAPPTKKHKSKKDYDRKSLGQELIRSLQDTLKGMSENSILQEFVATYKNKSKDEMLTILKQEMYSTIEDIENVIEELDKLYKEKK